MTELPPTPTAPLPPAPKPPGMWDDKANRVVIIGLLVGLVLFLGSCSTLMIAGQVTKTTTTVNAAAAPTYVSKSPATPSTAPPSTASPTTTKAPDYTPTVADFSIEVIELSRSCFGSAGCNVTYQIAPTYTGPALNSAKTYTVLYEVHGGDDVESDNFKMRGDGTATVPSKDFISTGQGPTLTATPTRVIG